MESYVSLDMTTLFVVRAFVQIALAIAIAITTLRVHSGTAPLTWVAGSIVNGVAWSILPLGLSDSSGDISSIQAAIVVLATVLHLEALAQLHGVIFKLTWWPLVPAAVLATGLVLDLDPVEAGTLMATVTTMTLIVGALFVNARLRPQMRSSTFASLALGSVMAIGAAGLRAIAGWISPERLLTGEEIGGVGILAYAASLLGLIVTHLTWLALLKDRAEQALERLAYADSLTDLGTGGH